jgi:ubiquinone/menaquinone biosynthesis C-methylase UbiE
VADATTGVANLVHGPSPGLRHDLTAATLVVATAFFAFAFACTRRPVAEPPGADGAAEAAPARAHAVSEDEPGTYMGRRIAATMSYLAIRWLERADREETEQPEKVLDALTPLEGLTVADVGAGSGYFTVRLARRVGARGVVYATDLQPEMIAFLKERVAREGLANVRPLVVAEGAPGLPDDAIDLVLMVDVYHEMAEPGPNLVGLRRALRPGGRLVLVEYRGEDPEVPIKVDHKMTLAQIRLEVEAAGFELVESLEFLPYQRVVIFRR